MTKQTASLVFFYFGEESYLNRLAQETMPLKLALGGYDRSVLLHHETSALGLKVSNADAKHANVVDIPTHANLVRQLNDLKDYEVDLFIFSHGWPGRFLVSNGRYGDNGSISSIELEYGVESRCLRAVYQCNCYGSTLNTTWRKLGAKVAAGTRFVNFYPTRFKRYNTEWTDGSSFAESLERADAAPMGKTPVQLYITADAMARLKDWDGTALQAPTILGKSDAGERYFRKCWLGQNWEEGKSGRENMNFSSKMLIDGDGSLKRFSRG